MIGQTISHYRVLEKLGEGGMGVVYKAEDTKLTRYVALKFPPRESLVLESTKERFLREARALATVNHPHVAQIYGVDEHQGEPFIVMELVDGTTLHDTIASRTTIQPREAARIGSQIAAGLHAMHARGVIHRDLKSSNILLDRLGQAKIADFGLALLVGRSRMTRDGATVGTVAFMSPEQARGEEVDFRTDIWSFGIILFEMLAGRLPFTSDYEQAAIYQILHSPIPSLKTLKPDIPVELLHVVDACLEKDRETRYQDAASVLRDLQPAVQPEAAPAEARRKSPGIVKRNRLIRIGIAIVPLVVAAAIAILRQGGHDDNGPVSIAVLPFDHIGDSSSIYATAGITEAIASELGGVPGYTVIGTKSTLRFLDSGTDVHKALGERGVRYIVEGSVQRTATMMRIFTQLVDPQSSRSVWSRKFERPPDDLMAIEDEVAGAIAAAVSPGTAGAVKIRQVQPTSSREAYELYLSGKYFLDKRTFERTDTAIVLLQRATELDRHFALAYAALGRAYSTKVFTSDANRDQEEKASVAIDRALEEDTQLAEAYVARAALLWTRSKGFPHERAARELLKALAINPNLVEAHEWLGSIYLHIGLLDKSLDHLHKALSLDPTSMLAPPRIGRVLWYQQRYAESMRQFQELPPGQWRDERARVLYYLGRTDEAFATLKDRSWGADPNPGLSTRTRDDASADIASTYAFLYAAKGDSLQALRYIASAQKGSSSSHYHHAEYTIACAYALLGNQTLAVTWLRKTAEDGYPCYPLFLTDPPLASLRENPQYRGLLERLKQEWQRWSTALE